MRAVVLRQGSLLVDEVPDPVPGAFQTLVKTLACGICGSDLHFVHHGRRLTELSAEAGPRSAPRRLDHDRDIVMGHEFVAEVLEHGPEAPPNAPPIGSLVVSTPLTFMGMPPSPETATAVGYSNEFNGGYAEMMRLFTPFLLQVPNGLPAHHAALTEPMAVGVHAVNKAGLQPGDAAIVHGCGPVGLAVIAALRLAGVEAIVASDFSPARRALATTMGASLVLDPAVDDVWDRWSAEARGSGLGGPGLGGPGLVQFDAIGVPGILNRIMQRATRGSRIVVVGVCMEPDQITPIWGINKELNLQFVLGYSLEEFAATLGHLAEGRIDGSPLITGTVDLEGVADAFTALANPETNVKILVTP
jgi:threonine dehydrogenase-like Zn-dependent dehydrogenase